MEFIAYAYRINKYLFSMHMKIFTIEGQILNKSMKINIYLGLFP